MTGPSKIIGHPVNFGKGIVGLFKQGWWDIPEVMGASFMALLGVGMATIGLKNYIENRGENREYKAVYYIVRQGDPRACELKNPAYTEYTLF